MDWSKLSRFELMDFLKIHGINVTKNLEEEADRLFNELLKLPPAERTVTTPVADLYIATYYKGKIPQKYNIADIRKLSPQVLDIFLREFKIPETAADKLERVIRILRFLNVLIEPPYFKSTTPEIQYNIALFLDYEDLGHLCESSHDFRVICTDTNYWRLKAIRDWNVSDELFYAANERLQNPRETYVYLAALNAVPIPGVEKYITNERKSWVPMIFNAARNRKGALVNILAISEYITESMKLSPKPGTFHYQPGISAIYDEEKIKIAIAGFTYIEDLASLNLLSKRVTKSTYWCGILIGYYLKLQRLEDQGGFSEVAQSMLDKSYEHLSEKEQDSCIKLSEELKYYLNW